MQDVLMFDQEDYEEERKSFEYLETTVKRRKSSKTVQEETKLNAELGKYEMNEETIYKSLKEVSEEL